MRSRLVCVVALISGFTATEAFVGSLPRLQRKTNGSAERFVFSATERNYELKNGSILSAEANNEMNGKLPKEAKNERKGKLPKPKIVHDRDGMPHVTFSDIPMMDKIDEIERDMKHNQEVAADMIEELERDLALQRMLRHESHAAMERLHLVKNDMERKMKVMEQRHEEEMERIIRLKANDLAEKDRSIAEKEKIIERYEAKENDLKHLSTRFVRVLGNRVKIPLSRLLKRKKANT